MLSAGKLPVLRKLFPADSFFMAKRQKTSETPVPMGWELFFQKNPISWDKSPTAWDKSPRRWDFLGKKSHRSHRLHWLNFHMLGDYRTYGKYRNDRQFFILDWRKLFLLFLYFPSFLPTLSFFNPSVFPPFCNWKSVLSVKSVLRKTPM